MVKQLFDMIHGQAVHSYILENDFIKLEVLDYGARVNSCVIKPLNVDVVLGVDNIPDLIRGEQYMGATVGRVCNRIRAGKFSLNGKNYNLAINNNGNALHGGLVGFDQKIFSVEAEENLLRMSYMSPDLEEGYPGELKLVIVYRLLNDGWTFEIEAQSDQDTLCSITNHAYFNLDGHQSGNAMNQSVQIYAQRFAHVDENGQTLDVIEQVKGTPFDFLEAKRLNQVISIEHDQLSKGNGFDHNFVIDGEGFRPFAKLSNGMLNMYVSSTMPCMHFYTGNFLPDGKGKNQVIYPKRSGVCFETQYYPSAIHYDCAQSPLLKKGETMQHKTEFRYELEGE